MRPSAPLFRVYARATLAVGIWTGWLVPRFPPPPLPATLARLRREGLTPVGVHVLRLLNAHAGRLR